MTPTQNATPPESPQVEPLDEASIGQTLPQPRTIPEEAQYVGLHEKLRTAKPSAKFLRQHRSQGDRLIEVCDRLTLEAAHALVLLKQQDIRKEAEVAQEIPEQVTKRDESVMTPRPTPDDSAAAPAQGVPPAQRTKRKRASERRNSFTDEEHKRRRTGERVLNTREASARVFAKHLHGQSVAQLRTLMDQAGIEISLLPVSKLALLTKYEKRKNESAEMAACDDSTRWTEDQLERAQLHFLIGRALVTVYDEIVETALRSRNYGASFHQWLLQGKDVNTLSRLASAMKHPEDGVMPSNGDMVPFKEEAVHELMREVVRLEPEHGWDGAVLTRLGLPVQD